MNQQDCIKFATENPICFLATADGDQPRVSALARWFANEDGFYFSTLSPKQLSGQLKANPKVEICFYNNPADLMDARQMRVTGEVEFIDDPERREAKYLPAVDREVSGCRETGSRPPAVLCLTDVAMQDVASAPCLTPGETGGSKTCALSSGSDQITFRGCRALRSTLSLGLRVWGIPQKCRSLRGAPYAPKQSPALGKNKTALLRASQPHTTLLAVTTADGFALYSRV